MDLAPDALSAADDGLIQSADGQRHCARHPQMPDYHAHEWGRPVGDDRALFEKICLEGFQSGMASITILRKREAFRAAFANFEIDEVVAFGEKDIERLMADAGIVRNRAKIVSADQQREARAGTDRRGRPRWGHGSLALRARAEGSAGRGRHRLLPRQPDHAGVAAHVEGIEAARLDLCRPDHALRAHAGDGAGQ